LHTRNKVSYICTKQNSNTMQGLIKIYKAIDAQTDLLTEELIETPLDIENVPYFEMEQIELDEYLYNLEVR
jgi:hypothetical protein